MKLFALISCAALVVSLSSCATLFEAPAFSSRHSELFARIDTYRDTIELVEVSHGFDQWGEGAGEQLQAVLDGKPQYPAGGGWLSWDLDQLIRESVGNDGSSGVRVLEARLVEDENGAHSLWRRFMIEGASAWVATWEVVPSEPTQDAATTKLMARAKKSGHRLWSLQNDALVYSAHVSADYAERFRQSLVSAHPEVAWSELNSVLSYDGTVLRFRYPPDDRGWFGFAGAFGWLMISDSCEPSNLEALGFKVEPREVYFHLRLAAGLP